MCIWAMVNEGALSITYGLVEEGGEVRGERGEGRGKIVSLDCMCSQAEGY